LADRQRTGDTRAADGGHRKESTRNAPLAALERYVADAVADGDETRAGPEIAELRESVAAASRRLSGEDLVPGTAGNVSARAGGLVAVTPTGAKLGELEGGQVAVVDIDGVQVDGPLAPTSELALHLGIHRQRGDGAVVHTHAPLATSLSLVLDELPVIHYQMLLLGGSVRVAPYATFGSPELAAGVLAALEGRTAALMANHGAVTVASDPGAAVEASLLLEWCCGLYWRAAMLGEPRALDEAAQRAVVEQAVSLGYGSTKPVQEDPSR
jgi:L-fuculose-phosphate aldolase